VASFHEPVLVNAVVGALSPAVAVGPLVDATCGGAGHIAALLEAATPERVVALDRDQAALETARRRLAGAPCPVEFVHADFAELRAVLARLGAAPAGAILADLGVSSHQLDTPERGFSFSKEGPLDMRMDPSRGRTAAELLESLDEPGLARLLRTYGEEPQARRIARKIVETRPRTTLALATAVNEAVVTGPRSTHPATRTFQALRIAVNDELGALERLLDDAPDCLEVGGRFAVITFHSLEDRRVKHRFRALTNAPPLLRGLPVPERERPSPRFGVPLGFDKGVTATTNEVAGNPRSRSARLRVIERIAA
jgi:16S rRNA (cytosine1402-N4)-methyltransferase